MVYLFFNFKTENEDSAIIYAYKNTRLVTNFISFLFTEVTYELGDKAVETINNVRISSTILAYTSLCKLWLDKLPNAAIFLDHQELIQSV